MGISPIFLPRVPGKREEFPLQSSGSRAYADLSGHRKAHRGQQRDDFPHRHWSDHSCEHHLYLVSRKDRVSRTTPIGARLRGLLHLGECGVVLRHTGIDDDSFFLRYVHGASCLCLRPFIEISFFPFDIIVANNCSVRLAGASCSLVRRFCF